MAGHRTAAEDKNAGTVKFFRETKIEMKKSHMADQAANASLFCGSRHFCHIGVSADHGGRFRVHGFLQTAD